MKVIIPERPLEVSKDIEVKQFGISSSAKFFKILSDGLYSFKIRAIIRELSTNASDSHVENGNSDDPFDVHLPTWSDKIFWIRDYGTGLSPKKFEKLYTYYGESDRDTSNEFTGCQGLGSKTPFCYNSRTFNVESWYNGIHYLYSCFFDRQGIPSWALVTQKESDDPSGVKISFATLLDDVSTFNIEAKDIYKYFHTIPKINIDIDKQEYILKGKNWGLLSGTNKSNAIMGQVAYPIDLSNNIDLQLQYIVLKGFDIFFEVGELDVETSREGLSYDNRTIHNIKKRLKEISNEITITLRNKISSAKSLWEARCLFYNLYKTLNKTIFRSLNCDKLTWHNQKLFTGMDYNVSLQDLINNNEDFYINRFTLSQTYSRTPQTRIINSIKPRNNIELYEIDTKTGFKARAKEYCRTTKKDVYIVSLPDSNIKKQFLDTLGINGEVDNILKKISSLPKHKRVHHSNNEKTTEVMKFNIKGTSPTLYWTNVKRKVNEGGIYIEWKMYKPKFQGCFVDAGLMRQILLYLKKFDIVIPDIYGIKKDNVGDFKQSSKWQCFFKWAEEHLKKEEKKIDVLQILHDHTQVSQVKKFVHSNINYEVLCKISEYVKSTDINSFIIGLNSIHDNIKNKSKADACVQLRSMLKIPKLSTPIINRKIYDRYIKLNEKYLLLQLFSGVSSVFLKNLDHLCIYIKAVNEKEKQNEFSRCSQGK